MSRASVVVKFVAGEETVRLHLSGLTQVADIVRQACRLVDLPTTTRLRTLCEGKELSDGDFINIDRNVTLHCIAQAPFAVKDQGWLERKPQDVPGPAVWGDMLDPSTILVWVFGFLLLLLSIVYLLSADDFDRAFVILLASMTAVYVAVFFPYLRAGLRSFAGLQHTTMDAGRMRTSPCVSGAAFPNSTDHQAVGSDHIPATTAVPNCKAWRLRPHE